MRCPDACVCENGIHGDGAGVVVALGTPNFMLN
jgi:hypothetical protein